jgi:hypothetical protein
LRQRGDTKPLYSEGGVAESIFGLKRVENMDPSPFDDENPYAPRCPAPARTPWETWLTVLWAMCGALLGAIAGLVVGHHIFDDFLDERLSLLGIVGAGVGALLGSLKAALTARTLEKKHDS